MGNGTRLGRVRGLGSSHHGSHHWLQQRLTALGNILLVSFLFVSLLRLPLADHGAVLRWASNPSVALALILMVISVFWHLRLGLQVMIEDYIHGEATRLFALVLLNFYAIGGAAYGIFAIVRIALAPAALGPGGM
ncbi:succinate dehydrogenase, hydrophobic membrane anchor protein [Sphingopyxis alaskensis]|jgi:succinate dehydrogenase / fumarate reductase, membrane anchor subunit|uniref:Succinate dehydrogenase hydrophobic membrane anchor subunit n=1 Tax=Sphingopyxis alaskensis (strain DSM 13593 / LMG 18877 / RB2256) TaxID=317655 RepID=Q1GNN7_SPHAL|nr:succinate dehydrogenase, hydrophobic membrane anchor protein [Sphingopyxis alaskensis]ABF54735.1 succinate dehydrogenase subunit D [Sphingopyxis alaskensis RB2256]MCM3418424.1 succinate dehydrogenase, hydrophobic membrane anchor protein [Sphingopyxis alaskensis]